MKRTLILAAIVLTLAGCRWNRCNTASNSPCDSRILPVSYGNPRPMGLPASYGSFVAAPAIPTGNMTELPFPQETIPPTTLPVSGTPNPTRAVGLPK